MKFTFPFVIIILAGFTLINAQYVFYQGLDSHGGDIQKIVGQTVAQLQSTCDGNVNCIGFNTNGWLKSKLQPKVDWVKWSSNSVEGLYVKPNMYSFYQGKDSHGGDIQNIPGQTVAQLKSACNSNLNCAGFNTNGWLKNTILPLSQWSDWSSSPAQGFYLRSSIPSTSVPLPTSFSVTFQEFSDAVTNNGFPTPSSAQYNAFIAGYTSAGGITSKRELAMFLAEILQESGGLQFKAEIRCVSTTINCPNDYRLPGDLPDVYYYGRGYIQLSWSYNYNDASQDLFADNRLVTDPNQVATNENISWNTAFWFWKTRVHSNVGVQNGQLGSATYIINGALECPCNSQCIQRFNYYKVIFSAWAITGAPSNDGC